MSSIERIMERARSRARGPRSDTNTERSAPSASQAANPGNAAKPQGSLVIAEGQRDALSDPQVAEEFRLIKRPLLQRVRDANRTAQGHTNLIMVTSALPDEGKTFVATNLAISIAKELDYTVMLVDADSVKAGTSEVFGARIRPGLIDYLNGKVKSLRHVIVQTEMQNLRVLPAGRNTSNATELLASETMRRTALELSQRYTDRVIIFDSAPLLAASTSSVLTGLMGQIVFVVEAGKTTEASVHDALAMIDQARPVNLVFNKRVRSRGDKYYSGYYGYVRAGH